MYHSFIISLINVFYGKVLQAELTKTSNIGTFIIISFYTGFWFIQVWFRRVSVYCFDKLV